MPQVAVDIQSLYIFQGVLAISSNFVIVFAFWMTKNLRRKENLFIVGIAMADILGGFAFFSAGLYRLGIFSSKINGSELLTSWDCLKLPHNWFFLIGGFSSAGMHAIVSIDRLIAIKMWLISYTQLGKKEKLKIFLKFLNFEKFWNNFRFFLCRKNDFNSVYNRDSFLVRNWNRSLFYAPDPKCPLVLSIFCCGSGLVSIFCLRLRNFSFWNRSFDQRDCNDYFVQHESKWIQSSKFKHEMATKVISI